MDSDGVGDSVDGCTLWDSEVLCGYATELLFAVTWRNPAPHQLLTAGPSSQMALQCGWFQEPPRQAREPLVVCFKDVSWIQAESVIFINNSARVPVVQVPHTWRW